MMADNENPLEVPEEWFEVCDWIWEGNRLFEGKRYSEALAPLSWAYDKLKKYLGVVWVVGEVKALHGFPYEYEDIMNWLNYRIGFCYMDACEYEKAMYYLDAVWNVSTKGFMEYINVIVNSLHPSALVVVTDYLENPEKLVDIIETPEEMETVRLFLRRRLGYLYSEYGVYNRAYEIFSELVKIPSCRKYAQMELDHINRLDAEQRKNEEEED